MEFFTTLHKILREEEPKRKIDEFYRFYELYKKEEVPFNHSHKAELFSTPSYEKICDIVPATSLPKRGSLSTVTGKAYLVHSILHIEYSAIDLALDHCYRFKKMPKEYYDDWMEVADDEIRHFLMLEKILLSFGFEYGDFPVHSFLFDISQKCTDLLSRMAVVPRYLEASGLDSSPLVVDKLKRINDKSSREIINALEIILEEEIDHVRKGDRWFDIACKKRGIEKSAYFDIVEKVLPGARKKKNFVNKESRKKAGFSCEEIKVISRSGC